MHLWDLLVRCLTNEFISVYMVWCRAVGKAYSNEIDVPVLDRGDLPGNIDIEARVISWLSDEMPIYDGCAICHSVQNGAFNAGEVGDGLVKIFYFIVGERIVSDGGYYTILFAQDNTTTDIKLILFERQVK